MARADMHNLHWWQKIAGASGYNAGLLSREMGVSRRQLQRYTQKLFGLSPQDWLNEQRLLIAADLLKRHRCVKTVAFHLGFKQVSHFSREFKYHYGVCPASFLDWNDRQKTQTKFALSMAAPDNKWPR